MKVRRRIVHGESKAKNHQRFGSEPCEEYGECEWEDVTFESEHEVVQRVLVLPVCFRIVLFYIFVDGSLHNFDSALSKARGIQESVLVADRVIV